MYTSKIIANTGIEEVYNEKFVVVCFFGGGGGEVRKKTEFESTSVVCIDLIF